MQKKNSEKISHEIRFFFFYFAGAWVKRLFALISNFQREWRETNRENIEIASVTIPTRLKKKYEWMRWKEVHVESL